MPYNTDLSHKQITSQHCWETLVVTQEMVLLCLCSLAPSSLETSILRGGMWMMRAFPMSAS